MSRRKRIRGSVIAANTILIVVVALAFIPLIWMLTSSLKTDGEFMINPFGLPRKPTLDNFAYAWVKGHFQIYFQNSIFVAAISLILMVGLALMAAFALTRYRRIRYGNAVLLYFIVGQMVSAQVILISIYLTLVQLHLVDRLIGLALVYVASGLPFTIFLLQGYFRTLPYELYEAAHIDGYGEWRMFSTISIPLARPAIATVFIIQFLYVFNEFVLALITIRTPSWRDFVKIGRPFAVSAHVARNCSSLRLSRNAPASFTL